MGFQKKVPLRKTFKWKVGGTVGTDCDGAATAAGAFTVLAGAAKMIVKKVQVVVLTASTGCTGWTVGDGSSANGYVATVHGQVAGIYPTGAEDTSFIGSYLGASTVGGTNANDPSRSAKDKYYAAATDITATITGTATAGEFLVIIDYEIAG